MAPLTVKAYAGRGSALLAFDVDPSLQPDLAGFAVECKPPGRKRYWLTNRLNFKDPVVRDTTPEQRRQIQTTTDKAPFQKFHWAHFPEDVVPGEYEYTVTAMRFKQGSKDEVEPGPSKPVSVTLVDELHDRFKLGFTRGYVSSQAYAERFDNSPLTPKPQTLDYDTAPFQERYAWLGFGARKLVFEFLEEAIADPSARLDVFAYDLDEPDFVRGLIKLGKRLRLYLDDSEKHARPTDSEVLARQAIEQAHGQVHVGCFQRYSHDKVMILKRHGKAQKVLAGSANFQVRGLYVQSNNVFVFDDPETAALYEKAFQQCWKDPDKFADQKIAAGWFERSGRGLPNFAVSFAPHTDGETALARVSDAIRGAKSSVLFAVMEIGASTGSVVQELERLPERPEIYGFGTTQKLDGKLKTATPSDPNPKFVPWSYLKSKVPPPFRAEWSGGSGQVIHHKFVVVDFNGDNPSAFAGSSNLAKLAEEQNGDNLVQFTDPAVVTAFAVEAIQLIDHYRFRSLQSNASSGNPLRLKRRGEDWSSDYFVDGSPKCRERELFIS